MKFRCERDVLADALATAGRAVSTRNTGLPALSGIHFKTAGDQLKLVGTDLDLTMEIEIAVVVMEEGACVIPARLIADITKSLPNGAVTIEVEGEEARISAGRAQFSVRTLNVEEFPKVSSNDNFTATLRTSDLTEALRQVVRAASSDDSRPVLTGVLMTSDENGLRLVATDSYRLAISDIPGAQIFQAGQSVLIPSKALSELGRLLGDSEEVKVALEDRELSFLVEGVRLTSRLIEGQFPDYRPLLPSNYPNHLRIDRDLLLDAVRRVKLLVKDNTTPVRMALRSDGVELTVVSTEIGQATDDVEAKYEGEGITVAFNPAYLIDGLEAVPAGDVLIETIDALKPATLRADDNSDFLYLIMPVRVS